MQKDVKRLNVHAHVLVLSFTGAGGLTCEGYRILTPPRMTSMAVGREGEGWREG